MRDSDIERMKRITAALTEIANNMAEDTATLVGQNDHLALVRHFVQVRDVAESVKIVREAMYKIEDALSREKIPEAFRNAKVKTVTVEGIGRVTISARWGCSMLDPEKGMEWLRNNELGGIIRPTVNAQTLAASAKNLMEEQGKEMPEDLFKTSINSYTSITKAK